MISLKKLLPLITASLISIGLTNSAYGAKFYKWVDEEGVTHYTEQKPRDKDTTEIKTYGPSSDSKPTSRIIDKEPQKEGTDKQPASTVPEVTTETVKLSKKECERLQQSINQLKNKRRIRVKGEDGELRYLSEDEHKQKIEDLTKRLQEEC